VTNGVSVPTPRGSSRAGFPVRAVDHCLAVTRAEAKNFHYGIRLLPPRKRAALSAVYAFARRADDIGDGSLPAPEKLAALAALRSRTLGPAEPGGADPILEALAWARREFPLPSHALGDLLDGIEADVRWTGFAEWDDLERYCRQVAGSVGRLSVAIFGSPDPERASRLGDDLGVAMQLTNIVRDLGEDLAMGRSYLPASDLRRFGIDGDPRARPTAVAELVLVECDRAEGWFERGLRLLPMLDPRSAACVSAMAGIYRRVLRRLRAAPGAAIVRRVSLPTWEKAWVAARSLAGAAP
jgi:phytoene synthase